MKYHWSPIVLNEVSWFLGILAGIVLLPVAIAFLLVLGGLLLTYEVMGYVQALERSGSQFE